MSVGRAVESILERGAGRLYDKYLEQKLPSHAHNLNEDQFQSNLKILSLKACNNEKMEVIASRIVENIPVDSLATRRIFIKRHSIQPSCLMPKDSAIDKSTKYQTVIQSQRTIN